MRRRIVMITTRSELIAIKMNPRSAETAGPGGTRGEACEDWCATNRAEPEPVPVSCLAIEEQEDTFLEKAKQK